MEFNSPGSYKSASRKSRKEERLSMNHKDKLMDMTVMENNCDKLDFNIETNTTHSRLTYYGQTSIHSSRVLDRRSMMVNADVGSTADHQIEKRKLKPKKSK